MYSRYLMMGLFFLATALPSSVLKAQHSHQKGTLLAWEQQIRNFMLDRSHNYEGMHYNRGLFRRHLTEMSAEHEVDLMTYRYSLFDDYRWQVSSHSYRLSMGSLNATNFAIENHVKNEIIIDDRNQLTIQGFHEENLRVNRFLFHLGYQHSFPGNHHVGMKHTLTKEKADLDATFFYRYGNFEKGMVEVDFTFMDWASNKVQSLAADSRNRYNTRYDVTHQYRRHPVLLSGKITSSKTNNFKAEIMGGVQTHLNKKVEQHEDTLHFRDEEWAHYLGGLLEYSNSRFTAGITYKRTFAKLRRYPTPDSNYELDFNTLQHFNQIGAYSTGRLSMFRFEQWVWYEYNIDRLQGETVPGDLHPRRFERVPFDYAEERLKVRSRLLYDPFDSGLKTGLAFHGDFISPKGDRASNGVINDEFRRVYSIKKNHNSRLTFTLGYRINKNFHFLGGISYDLDKDKKSGRGLPKITGTPTWFDGGFGRLAISW